MQCTYCGSEVANGLTVCPNCGGSLSASSGTQPPPSGTPVSTEVNAPPATNQTPAPSKKRNTKRNAMIIVLVILILTIIGGIRNCVYGDPNLKAVPDVVGMSPSGAETTITSLYTGSMKWRVVFTIEGDPTVLSVDDLSKQGYLVIAQDPKVGVEYLTTETLKITLDLKVDPNFVPNNEDKEEEVKNSENSAAPTETVAPVQ